jgi:hypothetical protein
MIGLLLTVLPDFVHLHLGLSPLWAGVAISAQYAATLVTRPRAGRMTDVLGPRVLGCGESGVVTGAITWGRGMCRAQNMPHR